jgi:hypothetical protein
MGTPTWLQMSLVLFIGMAAAMLVPPVRRSVPHWIEALIWLGLIASGWLTVANGQGVSARFLTDSVTWGVGQIVNVSVQILVANFKGWMTEHRYGIANIVVLLALLDFFLLAVLESRRQAKKALPRVRLGEWFEFAPIARAVAGGHPVDIRTLATAEPVGPYLQSGQSSALVHALKEDQAEEASTRLAS